MTRLPPGSPRGWLSLVASAAAPVATAALATDTRLTDSLTAREAELLEFAIAAHADSTRRWQPSFFDRRAERSVEASRLESDASHRGARAADARARATVGAATPRPGARTAGALMPAAIDGGLLSSDFLASGLVAAYGDLPALADVAVRAYARDLAAAAVSLGPASGARAVFEASVRALVRWLGWMLDEPRPAAAGTLHSTLVAASAEPVAIVVLPWARDPAASERSAASAALEEGRRWVFLTNGRRLRLVDATRVPSAALDCDLALCGSHPESLARLHLLCGPRSFQPLREGTVLDHARALSDVEGVRVCRDLRDGVRSALATFGRAIETRAARRAAAGAGHSADALTAVYRMLFLLFAEARGLVPMWHPVYRDGYTIDALASRLERGCDLEARGRRSRRWRGSPTPGAGRRPSRDGLQRPPLLAGSGAAARSPRAGRPCRRRGARGARLSCRPPGPSADRLRGSRRRAARLGLRAPARRTGRVADAGAVSARKTTGTFYTPRALTDYLVRDTLGPLVQGRDAGAILSLRVLDPAMGSGAFLVSACRFLAGALERALIVDGTVGELEIAEADRAAFPAADRAAMPVRRRRQPDGRATGAALAVARDAGRRSSALVSRASPSARQQPDWRAAGRRDASAARGSPARARRCRSTRWLDSQEALAALLPARAELERHPTRAPRSFARRSAR